MSKVYIDIGHGSPSKNPGATYKGRTEAADVIKLSKAVGNLLKAQGIEIKYSRTDDADPELTARCTDANTWGADYFVSFHRNACSPNVAQGFEGWIYSKAATNGDAYNKAKAIVDNVCVACGFKNRGIKKGAASYSDYAVNSGTNMASVLLECGFVDSDVDNKIYDEKFTEMATAIAKGICLCVGVLYTTTETVPVKASVNSQTGIIYTVQTGAFSSRDYAESFANALKEKGIECFVAVKGDVDGDGSITVADAREILKKAVEK